MITNIKQLIAFLPLLIVGLTVVIVMLSIAWHRNHRINASLTIIGLNIAQISLYFMYHGDSIDVTPLIRIDGYAIFYTWLVLLSSLSTSIFTYSWLSGYTDNKEEFYLLLLIFTMGGILLVSANHLASLFLGIELMSLTMFGLIGYTYTQNSLEASIKYMLLSATASSFLLFGMALLYAESGDLSLAGLGKSLQINMMHKPLIVAGMGMMIVGLGFKLSLVPFQLWTPDVYQGTPAPVLVLLATTSKMAIFVVLMRLFLYAPASGIETLRLTLSIISCSSILFGNLMAITQTNIKRLLGYSSIAHFGYLLVPLIAAQNDQLSLETVGVYLTSYLLSGLGVFGVISLISSPYRGQDADSLLCYRGLFWHKPILSSVMTVMMLSLAGIPMTLGFIGKFLVLAVSVNAHLWWLTGTIIVGSAIGLYYYLRVIVNLYLNVPVLLYYKNNIQNKWAFNAGSVVVLTSTVIVLILGVYPQPLITLVKMARPLFLGS